MAWETGEVRDSFSKGLMEKNSSHRYPQFWVPRRLARRQRRKLNWEAWLFQTRELRRNVGRFRSRRTREFVTVAPSFPDECRYVLDALREVYRFDAETKKQQMDPAGRLAYHQTHSAPVMAALKGWMQAKIDGKHVEPNSGLGQAIAYMLKHWEPLTLFLRKAGAPLDNNRCEQALKMAIMHRKNSLSYKTLNGARIGDLFMSLIHTCRLNQINPFAYLLAMANHPKDVQAHPSAWLPWNYPQPDTASVLDHDPPGQPA